MPATEKKRTKDKKKKKRWQAQAVKESKGLMEKTNAKLAKVKEAQEHATSVTTESREELRKLKRSVLEFVKESRDPSQRDQGNDQGTPAGDQEPL